MTGKERNAAAHMSPTGDAWDHMNMGAEVRPNPEDEMPKPPSWEHCEQDGPEGRVCCDNDPTWQYPNYMGSTKVTEHLAAEVTIEETVATSTEEDMPSPLERLRLHLWKLKTIRNPRKLKSLVQRQATLDSGATSTFMRPQDGAVPTGEKSTKRVGMPDGRAIQASAKALLPWHKLRRDARQCDILPGLQDNSLVSVGKLADAGYYTLFMPGGQGVQVFDAKKVKISISAESVLQGHRDEQGLWRVPIDGREDVSLSKDELAQAINNVFDLPSVEQTIRYLHACIGFPTKRTWLKAIKKGTL